MNRVLVVIGSRANYSSIKSFMLVVRDDPEMELLVVGIASSVLDRYGNVISLIENEGFNIASTLFTVVDGQTPTTMAKSAGLCMVELSTCFENLSPDVVVVVGDRFEMMAVTLTAAYMNIPIAHTMGGEVSGTIDESIRHAITKFAHIHFPASSDALQRIQKLGEPPETIHLVGCPRIDLVRDQLAKPYILTGPLPEGVGYSVDPTKPFLLVSQHPVTTEYSSSEQQIQSTLAAIVEVDHPTIFLWPNSDAGSDSISQGIRRFRELSPNSRIQFIKNLPVNIYIELMARTLCLVGNSSSGIREGAFIGTPVVNIGSRQTARQRGHNVIDSSHITTDIVQAIRSQIAHGKYSPDPIYGDGTAGTRIHSILKNSSSVGVQKTITY